CGPASGPAGHSFPAPTGRRHDRTRSVRKASTKPLTTGRRPDMPSPQYRSEHGREIGQALVVLQLDPPSPDRLPHGLEGVAADGRREVHIHAAVLVHRLAGSERVAEEGMGELLRGRTFQRVLQLRERLGGREDQAPYAARSESSGLRLEAVE